jgi:hypothetical protein
LRGALAHLEQGGFTSHNYSIYNLFLPHFEVLLKREETKISIYHLELAKLAKMSDGSSLKPEKDFSKEVDKQLPEAEKLAKVLLRAIDAASLPLTDI